MKGDKLVLNNKGEIVGTAEAFPASGGRFRTPAKTARRARASAARAIKRAAQRKGQGR